eukprot:gene14057-15521_t
MVDKENNIWNVCVIGAGIIGSATSYMLSEKRCNNVLLLEQFPLPHSRGSSHGQSRVIRYSYGQKIYADMMPECFKIWKSIEEQTNTKLFNQCGLLSIDFHPLKAAKEVKKNLQELGLGIDSSLLESDDFKQLYPMLKYADGTGAIIEPAAGVLMANKCGDSIRELFLNNGGTIIDGERVDQIIPGEVIVLKTSTKTFKAKKVIITAGPWTSHLTRQLALNLPLQPYLINVCYWKTTDKRYRADNSFPCFCDFGNGSSKKCEIYGLPCIEYPDMIKICLHHGVKVDADNSEVKSSLEGDVKVISEYVGNHFENVHPKPCVVERCIYTSTPDDDFIIDVHPKFDNIAIGAGFSGHGFKLAPVVGKLLSELILGSTLSYDITSFRISRFSKCSPHKKTKKHKKHKKKKDRSSSNSEEIDVVGYDKKRDSKFGSLKLKIKFGGETVSTAQVVKLEKVEDVAFPNTFLENESEGKRKKIKKISKDFEYQIDDVENDELKSDEIDITNTAEGSIQQLEYDEAEFSDDEESKKTLDDSISDSQSQISQPIKVNDDDEESKWLDALEAGELDDMGRLKKDKDVSLMTTRQRALYGHNIDGETELMELPIWEKRRDENSEEAQLRRKQRAKKRKQQMQKQIEETKAQTINKLLNKQASKGKKEMKAAASRMKKLGNHIKYISGTNGSSISLSKGLEFPLQRQAPSGMMFSGTNDPNRSLNIVESNQAARLRRLEEKRKYTAVIKIQAVVRRFITRRRLINSIRHEFNKTLIESTERNEIKKKVSALTIYDLARKLVFINGKDNNAIKQIKTLCQVILINLNTESDPKPYLCNDSETADIFLSMLMVFTDCKNWKILSMKGGHNIQPVMQQLCSTVLNDLIAKGLYSSLEVFVLNGIKRSNIGINKMQMLAVTTLSFRPLLLSQFTTSAMIIYILHVLSLPAFTLHLEEKCPEGLNLIKEHHIVQKVLSILSDQQDMRIIFNSLEGNKALCLLGNMVHLLLGKADVTRSENFNEVRSQFVNIVVSILGHCQTYVVKKQSNLTKWHPLLGWFMQSGNSSWETESTINVTTQLRLLWNAKVVEKLFASLPSFDEDKNIQSDSNKKASEKGLLRRAFGKSSRKSIHCDLKDSLVLDVARTCELFQLLASTLTQLRMEIFATLSLNEKIIIRLWRFLYCLGPDGGLKFILNYITGQSDSLPDPLNALLTLFCDCCSQLLPIIDDGEFYDKQKPFSLDDSQRLSAFLNSVVFKIIWMQYSFDRKSSKKSEVTDQEERDSSFLNSALTLLFLLYDRDCRRSFTPPGHWIAKELKIKQFLSELESNKKRSLIILKKIPHVVPHRVRVQIFRRWIESDKESLGIFKETSRPSALVTIRRSRLLEDGYEQLSRLNGEQLKGIIRINFVNEQGLNEAGIDLDGVFKEFLEDTIAKAFNPQLCLFKMTTDQKLYPSSTSFIQENHLQLFEFVGKMLAKAVFEGILVDVPFASFFLGQLLSRQHGALYSSIDELPSLDSEMYKSLCFIKSYDGDVGDLELTYSYDEDVIGKVVTHDLKPGGRAIKVTNANKFSYIHLMAKFRLSTHIREQTQAFIRGFRSVINMEWLSIFSPPEFQRLISGDTSDIDFADLKQFVQYYGGYHPGHRVILWLWDILENDFNQNEKKQFLKFVTSCSNPPLLGFKHLEPAFTIRYVECSDEEDTGDTVGSVVRGFFGIRNRGRDSGGRLPTASTCFNLLKLPNYKRRSLLRDKLRYAIQSGAGFELS